MLQTMVGLEAEFLLENSKGLVFPQSKGFGCDDFLILGEFRSEPASTVHEVVGNFLKDYTYVVHKAQRAKLKVNIDGHACIDKKLYAEVLRKMGNKEVAQCKNIYGSDILEMGNENIVDNKVVGHWVTCGLHVHFSAIDTVTKHYTTSSCFAYTPVKLPVKIGEELGCDITLYNRLFNIDAKDEKVTATANIITKPVLEHIVKTFDDTVLNTMLSDVDAKLKHRQPGFYEVKGHGFEYRSLPFNQTVLDNLVDIVDLGFSLLNDLKL